MSTSGFIEFVQPEGSVYVYSHYDGDTFPEVLHQVVRDYVQDYKINTALLPAETMRRAWEIQPLADLYIYVAIPDKGYHLKIDTHQGMVTYCEGTGDHSGKVFTIRDWRKMRKVDFPSVLKLQEGEDLSYRR